MEAAAVPTDGCKRERDGDDEAASKKLCKEEVSAVTEAEEGGGGKEMDTIVAETRDEDMKIHEEEVVDGKKVEPEEQEEVEKKSSNQEGDVVVPEEKKKKIEEAKVGPKHFTSSLDMLNYFHEFVRTWPLNYNVNKFEFLMLEDLIKQGHQDPENKIGVGIESFQVRMNPIYASRCYYIIRKDGSADDFSYRKCVDNIFPLPEELKAQIDDKIGKHQGGGGQHHNNNNKNYNRGRGGRYGGGRGGYGRGHRGGRRF